MTSLAFGDPNYNKSYEITDEHEPKYLPYKNKEDYSIHYYDGVGYNKNDNHIIYSMMVACVEKSSFIMTPDTLAYIFKFAVASHINANSNKFNEKIYGKAEKTKLTFIADSFVMGQKNDWHLFFDNMASQIKSNIKVPSLYEMMTASFSTSGHIHKEINNCVLMDSCKAYFVYAMATRCRPTTKTGIPHMIFEGTQDDWDKVFNLAQQLTLEYEMSDWYDNIKYIIDEFKNVIYHKNYNAAHWKAMISAKSDMSEISGWIYKLFPYLNNGNKNKYAFGCNDPCIDLKLADFPTNITCTPFIWEYYGTEFKMNVYAGAVGVTQDPITKSYAPAYGWIITHDK